MPGDQSSGTTTVRSGRSFQSLAARLSRILGAADESTFDVAIETCLEQLGRFAEVDVAFATLVDDEERLSDDWHWIREGLDATAPAIGSPLSETFASASEFLRLGHTITVDDLTEVELSPSEHSQASANGLRAIVIAPVLVDSQLLGLVGLQVFDHPHHWGPSIPGQIEVLARLVLPAVTRNRQRGALVAANVRARRIAEYIPDGLVLVTTSGDVAWASPSLVRMAGIEMTEIVDRPAAALFHPSDQRSVYEHIAGASTDRDVLMSARMRDPHGDWRWTDLALRVASEPGSGVADEIVMTVRDNHERHLREAQLTRSSDLDPLTGLLNRAGLDRAIADLAQRDGTVVVAFCDVDDFKQINDTHGHHGGDAALCAVAAALRHTVRPDDLVARVGGDEFVVVVVGTADVANEARLLGQRLVTTAGAVDTIGIDVTLSVGVCGPGSASAIPAMQPVADRAMYRAKRDGKNGWIHAEWSPGD